MALRFGKEATAAVLLGRGAAVTHTHCELARDSERPDRVLPLAVLRLPLLSPAPSPGTLSAAQAGGLLRRAADEGWMRSVEALLAAPALRAALPRFIDDAGGGPFGPLILAAHKGHGAAVRALLAAGAAVNARGKGGMTALMAAAGSAGRASIVAELLRAGADASAASDGGMTAALISASRGDAHTTLALRSAREERCAAIAAAATAATAAAVAAAAATACVRSGVLEDRNAAELARHGGFAALAAGLDAAAEAAAAKLPAAVASAAAPAAAAAAASSTSAVEPLALLASVAFLLSVVAWVVRRRQQRARLLVWLEEVYRAHAPAQLKDVGALAAQYEGREAELRAKVAEKYLRKAKAE